MTLTGAKPTTSLAVPSAPVRDPRTFWRVGVALALPVGPLLVTVARAILPYWTSQDDATIAANIAAHPKAMEALNWIGLPILPFMLITVLGFGISRAAWCARTGRRGNDSGVLRVRDVELGRSLGLSRLGDEHPWLHGWTKWSRCPTSSGIRR
jgi:hypothetical protein